MPTTNHYRETEHAWLRRRRAHRQKQVGECTPNACQDRTDWFEDAQGNPTRLVGDLAEQGAEA